MNLGGWLWSKKKHSFLYVISVALYFTVQKRQYNNFQTPKMRSNTLNLDQIDQIMQNIGCFIDSQEDLSQALIIERYQQLLNVQGNLINALIRNKTMITEYLQYLQNSQMDEIEKKSGSTQNTHNTNTKIYYLSNSKNNLMNNQNSSDEKDQKNFDFCKTQSKDKPVSKKNPFIAAFSPEIQPVVSSQKMTRQTKHVPKNYSKAILNFMLRNRTIVQGICQQQGKSYYQILKVVQNYKGHIYTVADLKKMWLEQSNVLAKIFRIVSMLYLRKHSLSHIFNSRIQNHARHIKYRYRIMEAVKDPQTFNRIKQY